MTHPLTPRKPLAPAIAAGTVAVALTTVAGLAILFVALPLTAWMPGADGAVRADLLSIIDRLSRSLAHLFEGRAGFDYINATLLIPGTIVQSLRDLDLEASVGIRLAAVFLAAGTLGGAVFRLVRASASTRDSVLHVFGPTIVVGGLALRRLHERWIRRYGSHDLGIELAPDLIMPRALETEHMLVVGGTGAGKTTILESIMDGAIKKRDRIVALDVKGELTARLPTESFTLLALDDVRSAVWCVGEDIRTEEDAAELARELIAETSDPAWSGGARRVLVGLIRHLQQLSQDRDIPWDWRDLHALLKRPIEHLHEILQSAAPEIAAFLDVTRDETRKQALSFHLVLLANAGEVVAGLARMGSDKVPTFSVRDWIESGREQALILQQSQRQPAISALIARLALKLISDAVLAPATKIDRSPLWLVLDELPQIGKSDAVLRLAAMGRSAGIRLVGAIQSPSQLNAVYGPDHAQAFWDNCATKLIGRVPPGQTATEISETWIGKRKVEYSLPCGFQENDRPRVERRVEDVPVVRPESLSETLGLRRDTWGRLMVRAFVLGHGDVYQIDWPVGLWPKQRAAHRPRDEQTATRSSKGEQQEI